MSARTLSHSETWENLLISQSADAGRLPGSLPWVGASFACLTGFAVLLCWLMKFYAATTIFRGLSSMKFNTALCILLLGISLFAALPQKSSFLFRSIRLVFAALALVISGLTLLEYAFHLDFAIDQAILRDPVVSAFPGRPGVNTAVALFCLAVALLSFGLTGRISRYLTASFAAPSFILAWMSSLGYVFSVQSDTGLVSYTGMAMHTTAAILLLSLGTIAIQPFPGLASLRAQPQVLRQVYRRLILTVIAAPIVGGWLALWGERLGLYGHVFRLVVLGTFLSIFLAACTYYTALCLARMTADRAKVTEQLRVNEKHLRAILDSEPACVKLLGPDCKLLEMNRSGLTMIEAEFSDQVVGQSVLALIDEPYRNSFHDMNRRVFQGQPGQLQFQATGLKGSRIWLETLATPLRDDDGVTIAALGITRDITEQRAAEQALVASERKFSSIFNSSPDAITISELDTGTYVEANRAFLEMCGYTRAEILGKSALHLRIWSNPADRQRLTDLLRTLGAVNNLDADLRKKDGSIFATQISAETIELDGKKCMLVITRDVSEKRTLEEQLRQAQKMEAVGQLAGGVAHDFNNLLMIMLGYAELIRGTENLDPRLSAHASHILTAGRSAETVIRQLLAFSRKQIMDFKVQDLNSVVESLGKILPRLIGENIRTVFSLDPALPHVKMDRGQLEQVLINLAVNARDAMPDGGKLTITTSSAHFDETYVRAHASARVGDFVILSVSDTGIGMDRETQDRVFEPFFTTKGLGKGTGLGLATVYGIVRQSNGFIWLYSEPGHGTTFKICLPVASGPLSAQEPADLAAHDMDGHESILLVEDETQLRAAIEEYLSSKGYRVISARNGEEALALSKRLTEPPDIVLTDVIMDGNISGPDLVVSFKSAYPRLRTILMSGYSDREVERANADLVLSKPFSLKDLHRRIRSLMASSS